MSERDGATAEPDVPADPQARPESSWPADDERPSATEVNGASVRVMPGDRAAVPTAAGSSAASGGIVDADGMGERPLSLRPRPSPPTVIDRGEQVYIDAWDAVAPAPQPEVRRTSRPALLIVREIVETGILALAIFLAVRGVVQNFRVEGQSMDPTYANGQYVLVNKFLYARVSFGPLAKVLPFLDDSSHHVLRGPRRGEVIVFHPPLINSTERDFIKRVIGLPGDHLQVRDNHILINGQELQEPYLHNVSTFCGGQWCDVTLGEDEYFVMGDNRTNSSDSRLWGPIHEDKIIGKTMLIYLPVDDFGPAPNQSPVLAGPAAADGTTTTTAPPATATPRP